MDSIPLSLIAVLLLMNLLTFFIMFIDKRRAEKRGAERISEGTLFFLATCFGSLGVYLGMFAFRHKNRQWHFILGIPLLFLENVCALYALYLVMH